MHDSQTKPSALALRIADSLVSEGSAHDVMDAARMIDAEIAPLVEALRIVAERDTMTPWCVARTALARTEGGAR